MTADHSRLALSIAAERLEQALTLTRQRLQADIDRRHTEDHTRWYQGTELDSCCWMALPETQRDNNGRYIVLDALTALVAAQTALVESA